MKTLLLITIIAAASLYASADSFKNQLEDMKQADQCVAAKIAAGVERVGIEVIGGECFIK